MSVARNRSAAVQFLLTLSRSDSPMEFVGQVSPLGACNLLEVPGLSTLDVDDDEGEVVIGIRPKSSPLPRRKSSVSDEDSEPEAPVCGSRRVSFADAKGLSLVQVKEFEMWDVPNLPRYDFSDGDGKDAEDHFLSFLNFSLPLSDEELLSTVQDQKVVLETLELLPGTTILKGVVRVLNISFSKAVYVRTTLDTWSSHFDLLAEYIPGSSDGQMDCFSFKLTLVPPFEEQGTRVDFCLRYETPVGTFWANNNSGNYVLFCHRDVKEQREKPQRENVNKRSCLKLVSQNLTGENCSAVEASSQENISPVLKQLEELNTVKDKRLADGRSAASQEDEQKLRAENRRNSGRRGQRKAAQLALLRDYFAQRDEGANGTEGDESPPEAKQAAQEGDPVEKRLDETCVYGSAAACGNVPTETSQAHNYTSISEPEKPENNSLAESAAVRRGESATRVPDKPALSDEQPAPAHLYNINTSASKAEELSLKRNTIHERSTNVEPEPADNVISHSSGKSLGSQSIFASGSAVASIERSCTITENVIRMQECLDATLNHSPTGGEGECLSVQRDHADVLQQPAEEVHSQHGCTCSHDDPGPASRDAETHPHTGNMLNMDSVNTHVPKESLCPQGEAQEDNVTYDLHSQAIAEAAQPELTKSKCSQIKTDLDATLAQAEREKVMTSVGVDEIVDKNNFTTCETSLESQVETHDAVEQNNLESCASEDEIIYPADTEVAAEVAGSVTKADHTRGDTFVQFKDKPIIVSDKIQLCEMKAAVATLEQFSPAEAKNWETTKTVEKKEKNIFTGEKKTTTTNLKWREDKVGLEDTGRDAAFGNKDPEEREKKPTGGEAVEREDRDADVLVDKQKAEEEESFVARTDTNVEKELEYVQATPVETVMAESEPAEGCTTEKRGDKRTNVQNKVETEAEKQTEIELRGDAQAAAVWDDRVKPREDNTEDNHLDYVEEKLVGAGEGRAVDSQGVTSESTEDGAGCLEERRAITQNEVEGGSSALVNNTPGKDKEYPGGGQQAHILPNAHEEHEEHASRDSCDSASAESDSDDEVELYMHCLRAVHAGTPAHGDRDAGFAAGKRASASRSRNLSTHMPSISESLDEEQHLSCLLDNNEDDGKLDVQHAATALSGGRERVNKQVSRWKESFSCSNISKTLLYATSLVVFLAVAYHYDFLACFALYLASVVWLCCQGDARTTRG